MTNEPMTMTCTQFDDALPDYLEEALDVASRGRMEEHLGSCLRCSAILRDINDIRIEASQLPELAPSHDLWKGIANRIEPTVLPFGVRSARELTRRWVPVAVAAAAALVIATAGVTYVATSRSLQPARVAVSPATSGAGAPRVQSTPVEVMAEKPAADTQAQPVREGSKAGEPGRTTGRAAGTASLASRRFSAPATSGELAYGDEIQRLQKVIADRRRELDPATVTVIEQNLRIIDAAVNQSRAALARDPKSGFLADQLNNALDKKVGLLRTVALLPSST